MDILFLGTQPQSSSPRPETLRHQRMVNALRRPDFDDSPAHTRRRSLHRYIRIDRDGQVAQFPCAYVNVVLGFMLPEQL